MWQGEMERNGEKNNQTNTTSAGRKRKDGLFLSQETAMLIESTIEPKCDLPVVLKLKHWLTTISSLQHPVSNMWQ